MHYSLPCSVCLNDNDGGANDNDDTMINDDDHDHYEVADDDDGADVFSSSGIRPDPGGQSLYFANSAVPHSRFPVADDPESGVSGQSYLAHVTTAPDDKLCRTRPERIRAKKARGWIMSARMANEVALAVIAIVPAERYLHSLFLDQQRESWRGHYGVSRLPLVLLGQLHASPVVAALSEYLEIQSKSADQALAVLVGDSS